jgi:hypothetical protein
VKATQAIMNASRAFAEGLAKVPCLEVGGLLGAVAGGLRSDCDGNSMGLLHNAAVTHRTSWPGALLHARRIITHTGSRGIRSACLSQPVGS